jgi:hypothetical protein
MLLKPRDKETYKYKTDAFFSAIIAIAMNSDIRYERVSEF